MDGPVGSVSTSAVLYIYEIENVSVKISIANTLIDLAWVLPAMEQSAPGLCSTNTKKSKSSPLER